MHVEVGFGLRRGVKPVKSDYAIQMHFAIHFPVTFSVPAEVLCFWRHATFPPWRQGTFTIHPPGTPCVNGVGGTLGSNHQDQRSDA
jgi:hypothetical protein